MAAPDRYRWVALANTTAAVFMSALDGSIVLVSLPAIFGGIHLNPLAPGNVVYLLWMIMGYRLVQAVLVVTLGRCYGHRSARRNLCCGKALCFISSCVAPSGREAITVRVWTSTSTSSSSTTATPSPSR
jgi:MFS family permease